jgi:hypothetical protein
MNRQGGFVSSIKHATWLVALGLVSSVVLAPAALAQNASVKTYGGGANFSAQVAAQGGSGSADPVAAGGLPFTGLDLVLAFGGGLALLMVGLVLARLVRPQPGAQA